MGSRDKDQPISHHQPLLSSLVIRPSSSEGRGGGTTGGVGGRGGEFEPGEVRRELAPYSRSERCSDDPGGDVKDDILSNLSSMWSLNVAACKNLGLEEGIGYRIGAGSASPRRRDADRYTSDFDRSGGLARNREFGGGRDLGRYRDSSPPYGRGKGTGRPYSRGLDESRFAPGPFRGDRMTKNNPNVRPREGDWYCADPSCNNLNFARREHCNSCNKFRYGPGKSPPRGYSGPPPLHAPPRRFHGPPMDLSPGRTVNGFRSPPRGWARDVPRELEAVDLPPPRYEGRYAPDHHPVARERLDYVEDYYRGRTKLDRSFSGDWGGGHRDRGRDSFLNERRGFERRPLSPLPPPHLPQRGRWDRDLRERSRSPMGGGPPPKDYHRDLYLERGREDRRAVGRERIGDPF